MSAQSPVLDRLQQEGAPAFGLVMAQPQVGPERGEEICGDDGGCVHIGTNKKTLRLEGLASGTGCVPRSDQAMLPPRSWRQVQAQVCVAGVISLRVRTTWPARQPSSDRLRGLEIV